MKVVTGNQSWVILIESYLKFNIYLIAVFQKTPFKAIEVQEKQSFVTKIGCLGEIKAVCVICLLLLR